MIRAIFLAIIISGCSSYGEKKTEFMEECLLVTSTIDCTYTQYNNAVTSINATIKKKHAERVISTETKNAYKARIIELNQLADAAYEATDLDGITKQENAINILRKLLIKGLGPTEEAML